MPATLEERVSTLEQRLEELAAPLLAPSLSPKDWRATFGMSKSDPGFEEMNRLGRLYRDGQSEGGNGCS